MAVEARKFPGEVEAFLKSINQWQSLGPDGQALLLGLGVKLEPFAVPTRAGGNVLRGFEMLARGAGGASYYSLTQQARNAGVTQGLLGVILFQAALLTIAALSRETAGRVSGGEWNALIFSINVDAAMLQEPALERLLESTLEHHGRLMLEASEDLAIHDVAALRLLLDLFPNWLQLALDDSNSLNNDTRELLKSRVDLVKADGKYVRGLYTNRDKEPDYMLTELRKLRQDRKPFVAEGVETRHIKRYLLDRWDVNAHGELWMQGYHIQAPEPWNQILQPLNPDPQQPEGYVLPDSPDARRSTSSATNTDTQTPPPQPPNAAQPQGTGGITAGAGAVVIGGSNSGNINTGIQINTQGGAVILGGVDTGGGDFTGRDRIRQGGDQA